MQAVILAAGTSTRTRPLTYTRPKPLLPILDGTILEHNLDQLVGLVDEVVIAENYLADMIRERVGDEFKGLQIVHADIVGTPGTGGTISQLRDKLTPPFLVINGDDLYAKADLQALMEHDRAVLISKNQKLMRTLDGWAVSDGRVEKLYHHGDGEPQEWGVATGAYILGAEYFDLPEKLISTRDEVGLPHTLEGGVSAHEYHAVDAESFWIPVGYPWDLITANEYVLETRGEEIAGTIEEGVYIQGNLVLGKGSVIRSGTVISGNVFIGENCIIGPNAYVRDNAVIGNNSSIGHAAEVKRSVIMNDVNIRHFGYISDSVIGSHSNIGAGTTVGNLRHDNKNWKTVVRGKSVDTGWRKLGAFLGDYSKTGINTSLIGGALMGPASWTESHETVNETIQPFHMGHRELPLEKFQRLQYFDELKDLKKRISEEETP